jgi:hypothetical protein
MFVKPHHRPIYPHLFRAKRKPLVPPALSGALATLSTAVHPAITRYPRLASMTRKWSPEHMIVRPREAFPGAAFADAAELAVTVFLERHEGASPILQEQDAGWLRSRLIGNFHCELPRHSQELIVAMGATGLVSLERSLAEKAAVLDEALAGRPVFLLQVPQALPPDQASDLFVECLREVFARCGLS